MTTPSEAQPVLYTDQTACAVRANASADPQTRLSDAELMAEMFTLTLAGQETTASSLTFIAYELAKHPEYQEQMRKEIQDRRALVLSRGDTSFTVEDLDSLTLSMNAIKVDTYIVRCLPGPHLTYYSHVLQETLRLHTIAIYLPRVAVKDDVIPLAYPILSTTGETVTEIPVRAGQVIFTSITAYHRYVQVQPNRASPSATDHTVTAELVSKIYGERTPTNGSPTAGSVLRPGSKQMSGSLLTCESIRPVRPSPGLRTDTLAR